MKRLPTKKDIEEGLFNYEDDDGPKDDWWWEADNYDSVFDECECSRRPHLLSCPISHITNLNVPEDKG